MMIVTEIDGCWLVVAGGFAGGRPFRDERRRLELCRPQRSAQAAEDHDRYYRIATAFAER
jgi:hypothetical protein